MTAARGSITGSDRVGVPLVSSRLIKIKVRSMECYTQGRQRDASRELMNVVGNARLRQMARVR
jgi:hypothetical protein